MELDDARALIAGVRDPAIAWRRLRERRGAALDGDERRRFHVRGERRGVPAGVRHRIRVEAERIALCISPGVPKAPCVAHPITIDDVVAFDRALDDVRAIEALAMRVVRALDAIGQPTAARGWDADRRTVEPTPRPVWRRGGPPVPHDARVVRLLSRHVGAELGVSGYFNDEPRLEVLAWGSRAWRDAGARGTIVSPAYEECGARLFVAKAALGRRYAELDDPFALLEQVGRLGGVYHGHSDEAIVLEWVGDDARAAR